MGAALTNNYAVFLRVLEYYAGVLMLTTNRVGEFDEAFRSRIHISLYYPKLDKDTTFEIWDMNLQLLKRKTKGLIDIDEKGIKEFYKKRWKVTTERKSRRWNGRQIKNAFQTALALANWEFHEKKSDKFERPHLVASHFKQVAKTSDHFDDYLLDIHGEGIDSDDDVFGVIARREGLRYDKSEGILYTKSSKHQRRSANTGNESESEKRKRSSKESTRSKNKARRGQPSKSEPESDSENPDASSQGEEQSYPSDSEPRKESRKRKGTKKDSKKTRSKSKKDDSEYSDGNSSSS